MLNCIRSFRNSHRHVNSAYSSGLPVCKPAFKSCLPRSYTTQSDTEPQKPAAKPGQNDKDDAILSSSSVRTASPSLHHLRNPNHHDLATFLTHAHRASVSRTSTTFLGTRYEYLLHSHLQSQLNFDLTRIGGRGDSGIDLLGTWKLPQFSLSESDLKSTPRFLQLNVMIQCKRLAATRTATPSLIRELEGAFRSVPSAWHRDEAPTLGILICTRPATKGIRNAMAASARPMIWLCAEEVVNDERMDGGQVPIHKTEDQDIIAQDDRSGDVTKINGKAIDPIPRINLVQMLWNQAAINAGLEGFSVGTKYSGHGLDGSGIALLWQGRPIHFGHLDTAQS